MMNLLKTCTRNLLLLAVMTWLPFVPAVVDDAAADSDLMVTRHFSGLWDQVDHENQGIALQVVHQYDGSRRAVAYWYTYGPDREPDWFMGIGELEENRVEMELYRSSDVGFLQAEDPDMNPVFPVGTMQIEFEDCAKGTVSFETDYGSIGSGSFSIERLAWIHNTQCSGGLSDDFPAGMMQSDQRLALEPVRAGIQGSGHAEFGLAPGHARLDIEVEGLPDGEYRLYFGPHDRGQITVSGGHGEFGLRSPEEAGRGLLSFDPRGQGLEIRDGQGAVLSSGPSRFGAGPGPQDHDHNFDCSIGPGMGGGHGNGHGGGMHGGHPDCVEDGEILEIEVDLANHGVISSAHGEAEWEMTQQHVEFSVHIDGVPAGSYGLRIAGELTGLMETRPMGEAHVGDIRFRDPQRLGDSHLDFDPRGLLIEILQGDTVILSAVFPSG